MAFILFWDSTGYLWPLLVFAYPLIDNLVFALGLGSSLCDSPLYSIVQIVFTPPYPILVLLGICMLTAGWMGLPSTLPLTTLGVVSPTLIFHLLPANQGLLNPLFLIHPPLILITYAILVILFIYRPINNSPLWRGPCFLLALPAFNIALIALMLGAGWAQYELNWGGWWGWDVVESGALFSIMYLIFINHLPAAVYPPINSWGLVLFFMPAFYLSLQLGALSSLHAFLADNSVLVPIIFITKVVYLFRWNFSLPRCNKLVIWTAPLLLLLLALSSEIHGTPWPLPYDLTFLVIIFISFFFLKKPITIWGWGPLVLTFLNIRALLFIKPRMTHLTFMFFLIVLTFLRTHSFSFNLNVELPTRICLTHLSLLISTPPPLLNTIATWTHLAHASIDEILLVTPNIVQILVTNPFLTWFSTPASHVGYVLPSIIIFPTIAFWLSMKR